MRFVRRGRRPHFYLHLIRKLKNQAPYTIGAAENFGWAFNRLGAFILQCAKRAMLDSNTSTHSRPPPGTGHFISRASARASICNARIKFIASLMV